MTTRIAIVSDTHGRFGQLKLPEADILIHAGDFTGGGTIVEISKFSAELRSIRHLYDKIIILPGNHDRLFESNFSLAKGLVEDVAVVLLDSGLTYRGIEFYGTPYVPIFNGWAFEREGQFRYEKFLRIPETVDVLITHTPPRRILDFVHYNGAVDNVGCPALYDVIATIKPELCVFGHIHEGYGYTNVDNITYINASICDHLYRPTRKPFLIDFYRSSQEYTVKLVDF